MKRREESHPKNHNHSAALNSARKSPILLEPAILDLHRFVYPIVDTGTACEKKEGWSAKTQPELEIEISTIDDRPSENKRTV